MQTSSSRRKFLAVAAAATCGGLARRAWAAPEPAAAHSPFELAIQSYSLRGFKLDEALAHTHELGLTGIELFSGHFPLEATDEQVAEIRKKTEQLGIKMFGHGVDSFTKDHAANRRIFELARKAGIRNITCDPHEDSFDSLERLVREYNIRVAIHNHGPGARYDKVSDVLNAIRGRHELIGACADLGHYIRSAEDPVRVIQLLKGRLYGVHLKDFADRDARLRGVILGKGHLDVEGAFRALVQVNFPSDGCLSLEYEEKPNDPMADLKECLAVARAAAKKVTG